MAELKSYMVESATGVQHYLAVGSGTPLVMLHGLGAIAASWTPIAEAFHSEYRVVIPDLAGHGASAPLEGEINFALQLAGLEAVMRAECSEPAILVGHSLGGWLGCLLTFDHPNYLRDAHARTGVEHSGSRQFALVHQWRRAFACAAGRALSPAGSGDETGVRSYRGRSQLLCDELR
jgi:pimeloyl-ACP methyl ester carboxylesterase